MKRMKQTYSTEPPELPKPVRTVVVARDADKHNGSKSVTIYGIGPHEFIELVRKNASDGERPGRPAV